MGILKQPKTAKTKNFAKPLKVAKMSPKLPKVRIKPTFKGK